MAEPRHLSDLPSDTPLNRRTLTLLANPAATLDAGWLSALFPATEAPATEATATETPASEADLPPALMEKIQDTPALSRLIFTRFNLDWPQDSPPFGTAAGRALLLSRTESRRFATHLGLACHRDWYRRLIDGRLIRQLADTYDEATHNFLSERENPFTAASDLAWQSQEATLNLGRKLWESMLPSVSSAWILRLRLKFPPVQVSPLQATPDSSVVASASASAPTAVPFVPALHPPTLSDKGWPSRLLERLFPECRWLPS